MNKRRKATIEMKRRKILKELKSIVEREDITTLQKKVLVHEIELYKQKNNDFYERNKEYKSENELFFNIIMFLLKNDNDDFISACFVEDQDAFYKRMLDYIMRYKTQKNRKYNYKKNNLTDMEENEFISKNKENLQKIVTEMEDSIILRYKESIEEKDNIIDSLKKKTLDLESSLKDSQKRKDPVVDEESNLNKGEEINVKEIMKMIEISKNSKVKELYREVEELKNKNLEAGKIYEDKELLTRRIEGIENILKQVEARNSVLLRDLNESSSDFKNKIKKVEDQNSRNIAELRSKFKREMELNAILKEEITDLESELSVLRNSNKPEEGERKLFKLTKELNQLRNAKGAVELEKRDFFKEKEKYQSEREFLEKQQKRANYEIVSLKSDLDRRTNASSFHKKNYLKAENELKYLTTKIQKLEKEHIHELHNFKTAQKQQIKLENQLKMLIDDIENYRNIFLKSMSNTSSPELLESLDKYRKLLRCSTCDKNYKDTVIIKCMHVLCKECVDNRLKMRIRKCPICGEGFSGCDVKRIFL